MIRIEYFPYMGPNRRSDKTVVEITLHFGSEDHHGFPRRASEIREVLINGGVLTAEEDFPEQRLPEERMAWYASLLAQTALLFQRKAGHRVSFYSVETIPELSRCIALLEHEHCDVGMTAVKLAYEVVSGNRRFLDEPFRMFKRFARERLLPAETEAIIKAAQRRDIPYVQLDRHPFKRQEFDHLTGGRCLSRNGLLMLGHGKHQHILDGTYCLDRGVDFKDLLNNQDQRRAMLENADPDAPILDSTADILLDWLFPDDTPVRMPIIAVTGTNGKTTTTRMINHIMLASGRKPGLVCTDGIFMDGQMTEKGDKSTRTGHLKVLNSKAADLAVLETHHGGILSRGFAFHWCDIAVCLNVTEDHLGESNVETVEQMAAIKRALPERARKSVVLNADDQYCLAMMESVTAEKICLVSMNSGNEVLVKQFGGRANYFCVLELIQGREWIVINDECQRLPVIAIDSIPASFEGTARFNVSNAMHAISASYLFGTSIELIRIAMSGFRNDYESTPGRLNVFDDLPFRVIMDFAHNPDGIRKLVEFIDRQKVSGRKLVAFAASAGRTDAIYKGLSSALAGHFDFYFCKEHVPPENTKQNQLAPILQQGLIEAGVAADRTVVTSNGKDVIFKIFDSCEAGDLLVMLLGHVEKHQLPAYIKEYAGKLRRL